MNVMPVAAFLKDFSEPPPEPASIAPVEIVEMDMALVETARLEGYQAGREEAMAEAEARLTAREAEFAAQLVAQREAWCARESKALAEAVGKGFEKLQDDVVAVVAQALKPFLIEEVRQKAVAELAVAVGSLLAKEPDVGLEITGPSDLMKILELKLSDYAGAVSFASANVCEVEVKAGHAVIATRIGAWIDKINEACP